ncbi:MAG: ExbD/TolR family protein, partial [Burkholderiaceae bacterium]|nr:ExbD/TolR family protein [Burkholderiaceae bacterium]
PAVSHRGGGRRRTINEINMVPFIDVMLVLLIIFMVSAPLITTGVVDLPTVGKSKQRPEHVVELIVSRDERIRIRVDSKDEGQAVALDRIAARVLDLQAGDANTPVVISADQSVKYKTVVDVMNRLQKSGVQRVGLSVKNGG